MTIESPIYIGQNTPYVLEFCHFDTLPIIFWVFNTFHCVWQSQHTLPCLLWLFWHFIPFLVKSLLLYPIHYDFFDVLLFFFVKSVPLFPTQDAIRILTDESEVTIPVNDVDDINFGFNAPQQYSLWKALFHTPKNSNFEIGCRQLKLKIQSIIKIRDVTHVFLLF